MNKVILAAGIFLIGLSAKAQLTVIGTDTVPVNKDGLQSVIIERISPSAAAITGGVPAGSVTYRMFVEMDSTYEFLACSGYDNTNPLTYITIGSTQAFYNELVFGGQSGASANPALYAPFPALQYDSYVSDGRIGSGTSYFGVPASVNTNGYIAAAGANPDATPAGDMLIPKSMDIFVISGATQLYDYNSGWVVAGAAEGPSASTNIVFIGQVTTAGVLNMELNISLQDLSRNIVYLSGIVYPLPVPPTVNFTSPVNGATVQPGQSVQLLAEASDSDGEIDSVLFKVDGAVVSSDTSAPYEASWTPSTEGTYTLVAIATDNDGQMAYDTIQILVDNAVPPVVSITNPLQNAEFFLFDPITIGANATDDVGIDSVVFAINALRIEADTSEAYEIVWTPTLVGSYDITATAYDSDGASTSSSVVSITVKTQISPTITIDSPEGGAVFIEGDTIVVSGLAQDSDGSIDSVEFFIDNQKIAITTDTLFTFIWVGITGNHQFRLVATDNDQLSIPASVDINVLANTAPEISIVSPANNDTIQLDGNVLIEAEASDNEGFVRYVTFYINDNLQFVDSISPYQFSWPADTGIYSIKATATDDKNLTGLADSIAVLIVDINLQPEISITNPENNETILPGTALTISITATDDEQVDSVIVFLNSIKLDTDYEAPYDFIWQTVLGSYTISAIAYDNEGASAETSIDFIVSDGTGTNSISENSIKVFPNPVKDLLQIQLDDNNLTEAIATLYDISGSKISEKLLQNSQELSFDMSMINRGFYLLVIQSGNTSASFKIVKE